MGLIEAAEARLGCALPGAASLRTRIRRQRLERGQRLFAAGFPTTRVYLVLEGIVKLSFHSDDGVERIRDFVAGGQVLACLESLDGSAVAEYSATVYEDAELESVDFAELAKLAEREVLWARCIGNFFFDTAKNRGARERNFLLLPPPERFARAIAERPWLLERISQRDLAAYIGITPVSLSRLRKRTRGTLRG